MKKTISVLSLTLGLLMTIGFISCGGSDSEKGENSEEQVVYDSGDFDFSAKNSDGVTLYYNYINAEEVEVTYAYSTNYDGYYGGYGYEKVKKIRIPSTVTTNGRTLKVTRIGKNAFSIESGGAMESITIPNSITSMGAGALGSTEKIIVSDIGAWCKIKFESAPLYMVGGGRHIYSNDNSEITNLVIPSGVTSISDSAFEGCESITAISLPATLESIGENAFMNCQITSITIPKSIKEIGKGALNTPTLTTAVISLMEEPFYFSSYFDYIFSDKTHKNATLYVPVGTLSKYKETNGWNSFLFIKEGTGAN